MKFSNVIKTAMCPIRNACTEEGENMEQDMARTLESFDLIKSGLL